MPGIGPLYHPAFLQRSEPCGPCRTRLYLDAPHGALFFHPCVKGMMVIRVVGNDRFKTGERFRLNQLEQGRCRDSIIHARTRDQPHHQQAQGVDQQMPLAPLHLLVAIIAALSAAPLRRLHRWAIEARRAGGGLPTCLPAGVFSQRIKRGRPGAGASTSLSHHRGSGEVGELQQRASAGTGSSGDPQIVRGKSSTGAGPLLRRWVDTA
jgi:hypothetical protein